MLRWVQKQYKNLFINWTTENMLFNRYRHCYYLPPINQLKVLHEKETKKRFENEVTEYWNKIIKKLIIEANPRLLVDYPNDDIAKEIIVLFDLCGYRAEFKHERNNTFLLINDGTFAKKTQ